MIREVQYLNWLANVMDVKKQNGQNKVCIIFDLDKMCPKDSFMLPMIDKLVDVTIGHEMMNFLDALL